MTNIPKDNISDYSKMFVRCFDGNIIQIKRENFLNDKDFYRYLWNIKFNEEISKPDKSFNNSLISYIKGINFFI